MGTALAADTVGSPGSFCFCCGLSKQHLPGDQRLCSTRVPHARVNLHSRGKTRNEPSGEILLLSSRAAGVRGEGTSNQASSSWPNSIWKCCCQRLDVPCCEHLAVGRLQALGRRSDGCSAATPSHVPALLELDLIPSCDNSSLCSLPSGILPPLPSSPSVCALWRMSSCPGVHSTWVSSP